MTNSRLAKKILKMVEEDQRIRHSKDLSLDLSKMDESHTLQMKKIIAKYGWPTTSLVGEEASNGAWLLIQHADHDLAFQKNSLEAIQKHIDSKETKKPQVAFLTDRILVAEKKKQLYGTQFRISKSNKLVSYPIADIKNLDRRRKQMGLNTYREYRNFAVLSFQDLK